MVTRDSSILDMHLKGLSTRKDFFFWGVVLVFLALQVWQHVSASYAFPPPWPDESHFLWQAVGFQEDNSLFSSHLNPDRSVFWMPPGYLISVGMCFKIFGVSLGVARAFSFAMLMLSFVALSMLIKRLRLPVLSLLITGVVFLNPPFVANGNIARPETMLLFVCLAGFLLIHFEHTWKGLFLIVLTPLIHPNGFYFLAGAVLYLSLSNNSRTTLKTFSRTDLVSLLIAVLLWGLYLLYISDNWAHFSHDMLVQFQRKAGRNMWGQVFHIKNTPVLLATIIAFVYRKHTPSGTAMLVAIALSSWLIMKIGCEMWYEMFFDVGVACFSLIALHIAYHLTVDKTITRHRAVNLAIFAAAIVFIIYGGFRAHTIEMFDYYPDRMQWRKLHFPEGAGYMPTSEQEAVSKFVETLCPEDSVTTVWFFPRADAFILPQVLNSEKIFVADPLFHQETPDLYILHRSPYLPATWKKYEENDLMKLFQLPDREHLSVIENDIHQFLSRDSANGWYSVKVR